MNSVQWCTLCILYPLPIQYLCNEQCASVLPSFLSTCGRVCGWRVHLRLSPPGTLHPPDDSPSLLADVAATVQPVLQVSLAHEHADVVGGSIFNLIYV